jgi:thioredoxin reductase (NADPH)
MIITNLECDLVVIGGGGAGCTATIYASASGKKTILIMGPLIGGLISTTNIVDNYTGFIGVSGMDLAAKFEEHAAKYAQEIIYDYVNNIDIINKIVYTGQFAIKCKAIIIATGSSPKKLHLTSEQIFENKGISYCAICDGFLFKNKDVAVIGGGNSAFEQVKYLSNLANHVYLIHRSKTFRAFDQLQKEVKNLTNVTLILEEEIEEFLGNDHLSGIKLKHSGNIVNVEGAFISIGHIPNTNFINDVEKYDGYIVVNSGMATNVSGIFACGDVCYNPDIIKYKQAIVACSEGCIAGLEASKYIDNLEQKI